MGVNRGYLKCPACPDSFGSHQAVNSVLTLPLPTPTPRFADFIALAFRGETQKSLLLRMWPRVLVGGCTEPGPTSQHPPFRELLLRLFQHFNAKHCFECSECYLEFTTERARDQVRHFW